LVKSCCSQGKKTYHHGNLRETLIESALKILEEGTLSDLSLRVLARKAGVSQTAPYRHFEDKDALIVVLKEEGLRKLSEGMLEVMTAEKDPIVRLQKIGMNYVQFSAKHPGHFKVMFEYELSDFEKYEELCDVSAKGFQYLKETVRECLALPNAKDINLSVAQFSAWAMVHGLSVLLMNKSLMEHVNQDHMVGLGSHNNIAEHVTKLFSESLVK